MSGICSTNGTDEKCIQIFVETPEGKGSLESCGCEWLSNFKIYFK
jgi:hypothetical protein